MRTKAKATEVVARRVTKKKAVLKNHFVYVLDRSGSMSTHARNAEQLYRDQLETVRATSAELDQASTISLYLFNTELDAKVVTESVNTAGGMPFGFLNARGGTALFDSVGEVISRLGRLADADDPNTSFLLTVITDGEDTSSVLYKNTLAHVLRSKQATDRWTIVFSVPSQRYKEQLVNRYGIPAGNIQVWDTSDEQALEVVRDVSRVATRSYLFDRSRGVTSSLGYFETDLSGVKTKDIKALDDLSKHFRALPVERECAIADLVEEKVGPYRIGCAFYELTKREQIQAHKNVLIREKNKRTAPIYGGKEARTLLGLPEHGDVKVTPGNHMNYSIFVQSTSRNRKLCRGTVCLYEV